MSLKRKASELRMGTVDSEAHSSHSTSQASESGSGHGGTEKHAKMKGTRKVSSKSQQLDADNVTREAAWPEHFRAVCTP